MAKFSSEPERVDWLEIVRLRQVERKHPPSPPLTAEEIAERDRRWEQQREEAERRERERIENDARVEREKRRRRMESRQIPERLIERIEAGDLRDDTPAYKALRERLDANARIIVLSGPIGCGKSTAACLALARSEASGLFVSAWKRSRTSLYSGDADKLATVSLLVLDDLGEDYADAKGFSQSILDSLIAERYDADVVTIITTNLTADRFKERYGERVSDRIREVGAFLEFNDPSMRKKAGGAA